MNRVSAIALAAVFAVAGCSSATAPTSQPSASSAAANAAIAAVGSPAPAFSAQTLDGKTIGLADFHGKVLVLNFWATWCPPCRAETPDMIAAYAKLNASDVAFLGVDTTETPGIIKSFIALKGVTYPVAVAGPDVYNGFGIAYIPTTIVIDGNGIVRARWTGGITPTQLAQYVAGARAGKNSIYVTAEQKKINAWLALSQFNFTGTPAQQAKEAALAQARLAQVAAYTAKLDQAPSPRYDDETTLNETGQLELAAGNALVAAATTPKEKLAAYALQGQGYGDLNRFADAAATYKAALAIAPNDPKFVGALTEAYYRLHDYSAMAQTATQWTQIAPSDPSSWDQLALSHQRARQFAQATAPYEKALSLLEAAAAKQPIGKNGEAVAYVADEALDVANVYVSLGDATNAKRVFAISQKYANLIPAGSEFAGLKTRVPDRIVEGMAGVALAHSTGTTVQLTKWTGADLPGSLATTYKWRLIAVAPAGKSVTLTTKGLKKDWIASFCQDRLCSPNSVTFTMPADGVRSYEFQLVAPTPDAQPGIVSVGATDGNWVST